MKVFVAGASGTVGRPLVRQLVAAGHEVTGTTRAEPRSGEIRAAGAEAVVCDVFDADALTQAVEAARPEVVINELTSLPREYNPRQMDERFYAPTNRVRTEGGANLLSAARSAGAKRFVTQSIAFLYAPEGEMVKDEGGRAFTDAPGAFGTGVKAMTSHEQAVLQAEGIEGLVLRYGWFYGAGTYYAADGSIAEMCGNGMRVFARYLVEAGLAVAGEFGVATRAGVRRVRLDADHAGPVTVDMGPPRILGGGSATVSGRSYDGLRVDMGNPHLACVISDPVAGLDLTRPPTFDVAVFPGGVNVELLNPLGDHHCRMRVYERGSGETRSCGTGAVACAVAMAQAAGETTGSWTVEVPGGTVEVTLDGRTSHLTGPAVLVAEGDTLAAFG